MKKKRGAFIALIVVVASITGCMIHAQLSADKEKNSGAKEPAPPEVSISSAGAANEDIGAKEPASPEDEDEDMPSDAGVELPALFSIEALYGVPFEADIGGGLSQVMLIMDDNAICFYNYKGDEQTAAFTSEYRYDPASGKFDMPGENVDVILTMDEVTFGRVIYKRSNRIIEGEL
jgi:hypothetical protein